MPRSTPRSGRRDADTVESVSNAMWDAGQKHRQTFQYESDRPKIFAAADNGATPVEFD